MDRRRLVGVALVLVSACAFGSGALFGKPAYATGIDWLTLSAWRFLFGATASWIWVAASASRRAALRDIGRPALAASVALGLLYLGNSGTYYAGLERVDASLAALIVYIYPALVPRDAWPYLVGIGVVATFVAIQTFYAGTRRVGAAQASLISTIEPIWTISLAALLLGESLSPIQLAGGVLILLGVVIAQTGPSAAAVPR